VTETNWLNFRRDLDAYVKIVWKCFSGDRSFCHNLAFTFIKLFTPVYTHTHPFNGPFSRTTWVGRYQKGKTNLDFTEARHSEWQWHQLGHMQVCTSLQTDNHASTPPLSFLQAGCLSCRPTNSVEALKAHFPHWLLLLNWRRHDVILSLPSLKPVERGKRVGESLDFNVLVPNKA